MYIFYYMYITYNHITYNHIISYHIISIYIYNYCMISYSYCILYIYIIPGLHMYQYVSIISRALQLDQRRQASQLHRRPIVPLLQATARSTSASRSALLSICSNCSICNSNQTKTEKIRKVLQKYTELDRIWTSRHCHMTAGRPESKLLCRHRVDTSWWVDGYNGLSKALQ